MIQHPLSGMHVVLIKTAGGRKAGVCYNCGHSMTVPVSGNRGLSNRYVCFISLQHQCWMLPDCKRFITIMEEAEADYVIKAGFPETTYIIVTKVPTLTLTIVHVAKHGTKLEIKNPLFTGILRCLFFSLCHVVPTLFV